MKKLITLALLSLILQSCHKEEPISNYKGCIVHWKGASVVERVYKLQKDTIFVDVYVTDFDYKKYYIGDTIK